MSKKTKNKKSKFGFIASDCKEMSPAQKGEILELVDAGKTKKEIAGIVDRSMDWIETITEALRGTDAWSWCIKKWKDKKDDTRKGSQLQQHGKVVAGKGKKKTSSSLQSSSKRSSNKTVYPKRNRRTVSRSKSSRYNPSDYGSSASSDRMRNRSGSGKSLKDKLKESVDYKE